MRNTLCRVMFQGVISLGVTSFERVWLLAQPLQFGVLCPGFRGVAFVISGASIRYEVAWDFAFLSTPSGALCQV